MNQHAKRRHQAGLRAVEAAAPQSRSREEVILGAPLPPGRHEFEVDEGRAGLRLDRFLAEAATGLSRTRLKSLVESGQVTIDGATSDDAGAKVRLGQRIAIDIPQAAAAQPEGENIPLKIVYEDDDLIVIDKPAGLVVHPSAGHESGTLVNALIAHCGESLSGIGGVKRPGIVHRLDKDTTGLLVVAKTDTAHQGLAALFEDHGRTMPFEREYIAFVWGAPARRSGTINAPLGRHIYNRERQAVVDEDRGREAITHYSVESIYGADRNGVAIVSRVRCALETGRTHQIRVHLAHIGTPVVGDQLYATGFKTKAKLLPDSIRKRVDSLRRQALHAAVLGFEHPVTGKKMRFESKLPADLADLQKALAKQYTG